MPQDYQGAFSDRTQVSIADAYRIIRTNIYFSKGEDQPKIIMFTSALPGEGKSTIAANTAIAYAQTGKRVILVDCNLHRPVQHKLLNKDSGTDRNLANAGLGDYLRKKVVLNHIISDTGTKNLRLISSGYLPLNPAEFLASADMEAALDDLKTKADIIILDTPAVTFATDACILAAKTDGIAVVVNVNMARPEVVRKAKQVLEKANGQLLGVVLNRVKSTQ
ncbi:MAG TPA: CpsD/CapB family tyrosine-protein kinase [Methylomusa anaerophila]|uniref:Tyrosine-protein kinase YwqD n=1 Tax=Methylomusa anaerophila TaxID=1930071 RepID=A0A348AI18_9FIRM|nr:CpsD/CapB family tyrosine-protein kinase [Methylomusa anaerophila]BBB90716.1 tyrosine-protein kinase YwqD [Methylomusa anaerophila]HML88681.1 CpsD/CapB family tyrosine-protein kinase [Methylomusa anaerophila]